MANRDENRESEAQDLAALLQAERTARQQAEHDLTELREKNLLSGRTRTLGHMATGMAHELSQPLTGVIGQAEFLQLSIERGRDFSREEILQHLKPMIEQAERMVHIINSVRHFAYAKPTTAPVCVNAVARQTLDLLQTQLRTHNIDLSVETSDNLPPVLMAKEDLEEVLLNLLFNARDAIEESEQRSGKITVRTAAEAPNRVTLSIAEDGDGIAEELQERAFEPFFSTRSSELRAGLGLSIARAIAEGCGGELTLSSQPGTGTLVVLTLPVAPDHDQPHKGH
ncbi:MAG: histidine kinase [Planctomycetota bacterium]|jgi:histidine kinase